MFRFKMYLFNSLSDFHSKLRVTVERHNFKWEEILILQPFQRRDRLYMSESDVLSRSPHCDSKLCNLNGRRPTT